MGAPMRQQIEHVRIPVGVRLRKPREEFRPILEATKGKKTVQLAVVPEDGRRLNGANQHTGPNEDSGHEGPNPDDSSGRHEKRLRAILRAPEQVRDLYRADLIGLQARFWGDGRPAKKRNPRPRSDPRRPRLEANPDPEPGSEVDAQA